MTDRGVSVSVNYVLTLGIATLLMTTLLFATGNIVDDRLESSTRSELEVVGERVASSLMAADRLAQTGSSVVEVETRAPDRVAGLQYTVTLNATSQQVVLETADPEVVVRVPFDNTTAVAESSASGGRVRIVLADPGGSDEALEVQSS